MDALGQAKPPLPEAIQPDVHVLIVDDEAVVRETLSRMLAARGIRATTAAHAEEALLALENGNRFDVLLTDLKMVGMDGLQLVSRANEIAPEMPKILVTGYGSREDAVAALRLGVHDFISKPVVDRERLIGAVLKGAELSRLRRENARQRLELEETIRELRNANRIIRRHSEQLEQDLVTAASIQRHLLPHKLPSRSGFRFSARFQPSERVSGDFYQVLNIDPAHLLIIVADVAGHGVGAAMLTVLLSQAIEVGLADISPKAGAGPSQMLTWLNQYLASRHDEHTPFVTMMCGVLDLVSGWMTLACAGHEPPLLQRSLTGRVESVEVRGMGLGLLPNVTYEESLVDLAPGDRLLIYTDGITEAASPEAELFGEERLAQTLAGAPPDVELAADHILNEVHRFAGKEQNDDDVCLLMVQRLGAPAPPPTA